MARVARGREAYGSVTRLVVPSVPRRAVWSSAAGGAPLPGRRLGTEQLFQPGGFPPSGRAVSGRTSRPVVLARRIAGVWLFFGLRFWRCGSLPLGRLSFVIRGFVRRVGALYDTLIISRRA